MFPGGKNPRDWVACGNALAIVAQKWTIWRFRIYNGPSVAIINEVTRLIAMKTSAGFLSIDERGTIRAIDPFGQAITGYPADQVVGKNIGMLIARQAGEPDAFDLAVVGEHVQIVGMDTQPVWVGRDSRPIDVALSFSPSQGQLVELFVATVRVPVPQLASESRMAELFLTSAAPMQSSDRDGRIEFVNDAWLDLLGYRRDEVVGHHGREFMCDGAHWQQLLAQLQRGEQIHGQEIQARRKDGRILSLLLNSSVARDATGMAYTRSTLTDITDFRATERNMRLEVHGTAALAVAETLGVFHQKVLSLLARAGDAECVGVWLPSPDRGTLTAHATWCSESGTFAPFDLATKVISFAPGVGLPGRTWQTGLPHIVADLRYDSNYLRQREAVTAGLFSGLAFPLVYEGKVLGVIDMYSRECIPNDANIIGTLTKLGHSLGSIFATAEHTTNHH